MAVFDDLLGDPSGTTNLAEPDVRRLTRRARWMAERRAQPAGVHRDVAQIRDRASEQATLARQIAEALQVRDVVHARVPLGSGTALCWPWWNCRRARTIKTGWPSITRRPLYAYMPQNCFADGFVVVETRRASRRSGGRRLAPSSR